MKHALLNMRATLAEPEDLNKLPFHTLESLQTRGNTAGQMAARGINSGLKKELLVYALDIR